MTVLAETIRGAVSEHVAGAAVVSRDGTVLAAEIPDGVSRETFSIMCATIHGAGVAAATELHRQHSRSIVLDSGDGAIVIVEAGRRALLVLVLQPGADVGRVMETSGTLIERVARETA